MSKARVESHNCLVILDFISGQIDNQEAQTRDFFLEHILFYITQRALTKNLFLGAILENFLDNFISLKNFQSFC